MGVRFPSVFGGFLFANYGNISRRVGDEVDRQSIAEFVYDTTAGKVAEFRVDESMVKNVNRC